ncbi:MAG: hypothetical protein IJX08_04815 [Clostridia bacterium]|nr:hypothetical protein [Clostridia bacterium]MBQ8399274.1 hypothetical protein [Clostridia bacterium]
MLTIQNNTENVVVVHCASAQKEIAIGKSESFSDEELSHERLLEIKYFSLKKERKDTVVDVNKGVRKSVTVDIYNESLIPTGLLYDAKGSSSLILSKNDTSLFFLFCFWKRFALKGIAIREENESTQKPPKGVRFFYEEKHKKKILAYLLVDFFLTLLLALGLLTSVLWMLLSSMDGGAILWVGIFTLLVGALAGSHLYHFVKMKEWKNAR